MASGRPAARHLSADTTHRCAALPRVFDILFFRLTSERDILSCVCSQPPSHRASAHNPPSSGNSSSVRILYAPGRANPLTHRGRPSRSRNASSVRTTARVARPSTLALTHRVYASPRDITLPLRSTSVLYALRIASSRRLSEVPLSCTRYASPASTASRPRAPHLYQPPALWSMWSSYHIIVSNLLYCVRD